MKRKHLGGDWGMAGNDNEQVFESKSDAAKQLSDPQKTCSASVFLWNDQTKVPKGYDTFSPGRMSASRSTMAKPLAGLGLMKVTSGDLRGGCKACQAELWNPEGGSLHEKHLNIAL